MLDLGTLQKVYKVQKISEFHTARNSLKLVLVLVKQQNALAVAGELLTFSFLSGIQTMSSQCHARFQAKSDLEDELSDRILN